MVQQAPTGLWTVSGPSGAGKSTLIAALRRYFPEAAKFRSVTSRQKRGGETAETSEYRFISIEQFSTLARDEHLLWNELIHGNRYGASYQIIHSAFSGAEYKLVIADIAFYCSEKLMKYAAEIDRAELIHAIYLDIEDESELRRRLLARNEPDIECRITECRGWTEKVRSSFVPFHIIDARQSKETLLEQALDCLTQH